MTTPDIILELLSGPKGLDDRAAYLRVDKAGIITHAGGRLDRFFDRAPVPGDPTDGWSWLQGLPTPTEVDIVEIFPRRWADIVIRAGEGNARWVLLTEASAPIGTMQAILQESQELSLRARDQLLLGDALTILDAVAFVPTAEARFRVVGRLPDWFREVVSDTAEEALDLVATWTFLESFLLDAETVWTTPRPGHVRSGIWIESASAGDELPLEATALRTRDGERVLILQRVAERFTDQQRTLQQARDLSMQHQHLIKEIEKKEILLHCVVHDLGSPLGAIIACLDTVQPALAEQTDLRTLVDIGLRQARRQEALISQVLDVFRADLDSLREFSPPGDRPDLRASAVEQVTALAPYADSHGVTLELDIPAQPVWVSATASRLDRVLANLIDNAVRHAPRGGRVEVVLVPRESSARLEIRDDGPGVPEETQPYLFDKLYQGPSGGKAGLGLYFCKMMTDRWGGEIGYSPRTQGACFWVHLPLASRQSVPSST